MFFRKQSFFLFIALLSSIGSYILWNNTTDNPINNWFIYTNLGGIAITFILALFSLMNYRNRKIQIISNILNMILNALLIGLSVYWTLNLPGEISISEKGIKLLFPVISIVVLLIANSYIRKDDRLVKSVDRFR